MAPEDIALVTAAFPGVAFFVMYGQTEATARLTCLSPEALPTHQASVGRPIPGVRIQVRRPDGTTAAPGESGEVLAAGPGIMKGYWRAPGATRAALRIEDRERWLCTGDLGHVDRDGFLYLEGRRSDFVKVAGHRVNPVETEEAARLLPGIEEAAVVGLPDRQHGTTLRMLVVRAPGASITAEQVLAHCRRRLSAYKLPRDVVFVDHLPRTGSGKLQRWRLAEM
jgi:long-chain acyl-CoA synthetase